MAFRDRYERSTLALDATSLLALPVVLVALQFLLPGQLHDAMVFDHSHLDPVTMWTSAYVHLDAAHLTRNLLGYSVVAPLVWAIFLYRGERRRFWVTVLAFLLVFPLLISSASYLVFRFQFHATEATATRGFSGVAAAFYGLLLAAIAGIVEDVTDRWRALNAAMLLVLAVGVRILTRADALTVEAAALGLGGMLLAVTGLVPHSLVKDPTGAREWVAANRWWTRLVAVGALVVVVMVPLLFPLDWAQGQGVTNVIAHGAGFVFGGLTGLAIWR